MFQLHHIQFNIKAMGNTLPVYIPCLINKIKCICILLALGRNTMSNVDNQAAFYKYCIHPTEG